MYRTLIREKPARSYLLSPDLLPSGDAVSGRALRIGSDGSWRITVGWCGYRCGLVTFLGRVVWQSIGSSAVDIRIHGIGGEIA